MTFRIFSKSHNLYTNSPLWPSNQRSTSDFLLTTSGEVIELVCFGDSEFSIVHPPYDFSAEPWTGLFDSKGKKIYLGDIIKLDCFNLEYEVVWRFDRFLIAPRYELPSHLEGTFLFPMQSDLSKNYSVIGTIHEKEYND